MPYQQYLTVTSSQQILPNIHKGSNYQAREALKKKFQLSSGAVISRLLINNFSQYSHRGAPPPILILPPFQN